MDICFNGGFFGRKETLKDHLGVFHCKNKKKDKKKKKKRDSSKSSKSEDSETNSHSQSTDSDSDSASSPPDTANPLISGLFKIPDRELFFCS